MNQLLLLLTLKIWKQVLTENEFFWKKFTDKTFCDDFWNAGPTIETQYLADSCESQGRP